MIAAAPYRKLRELLEVQEVSWDEYAAALADWYTLGSITNQNGTMFWCTNCRDDRVSCNLDARLAPDNLSLPCPRCKGSMHFVTAYFVAPWLREVLFSKDGFLLFALAMHLSKSGRAWESGKHIGGFETDLLVEQRTSGTTKTVVIEAKMFQTDRTADVVGQNLTDAARQIIKSTDAIIQSGRLVQNAIVVSNYDLNRHSEVRRKVSETVNRRRTFQIHILDYQETIDWLGRHLTEKRVISKSAVR